MLFNPAPPFCRWYNLQSGYPNLLQDMGRILLTQRQLALRGWKAFREHNSPKSCLTNILSRRSLGGAQQEFFSSPYFLYFNSCGQKRMLLSSLKYFASADNALLSRFYFKAAHASVRRWQCYVIPTIFVKTSSHPIA